MSTLTEIAEEARVLPVLIRAIEPPTYDNTDVRNFKAWYLRNQQKLENYWHVLGMAIHADLEEGKGDFFLFAAIQHERQL